MGRLISLWAAYTLFLAAVAAVLHWDAQAFEVNTYSLPNVYEQHVLITKYEGSLRDTVNTCTRRMVVNRVAMGYTPSQAVSEVQRATTGEGCAMFDDNLTRCLIYVTAGRPWVTAHEERHCMEGAFH